MISPRCLKPLGFLAAIALAGCSTTGRHGPLGTGARSRSVAVIGDRPMAPAVGEPGSRVASDADEPALTAAQPAARSRISGRVLDADGEPVPEATVRLADGTAKAGRDLRTTTDRSGAFTLSGLRPGSIYTLIAESDEPGGRGRGSAEARSSETGVEITLADGDGEAASRTVRPARARSVSNRAEADEGAVGRPGAGEDAGTMPEDAAPDEDVEATAETPRRAEPGQASGWRKVGAATPAEPAPPSGPPEAGSEGPAMEAPDEGPNPLPPAIDREGSDPERTSSRPDRRGRAAARSEPTATAGGLALADEPAPRRRSRPAREAADDPAPVAEAPAADEGPVPTLDGAPAVAASGLPEMPPVAPGGDPAPSPMSLPAAAPPPGPDPLAAAPVTTPAPEPVFASEPPAPPAPADYNPFANPFVTQASQEPPKARPIGVAARPRSTSALGMDVKPGPSKLARKPPTAPAAKPAPAKKMTWGELSSQEPAPVVAEAAVATATASKKPDRARGEKAKTDEFASLCTFDARLGKIVDFRLPDLEGNPVSLKDLDADLILLDFWGTWCKPCVEAVPHLVELQKKFGPGKLAVVGIACEEDEPKLRKAKVEEMSRQLGINYSVLLSGMDGPCPLRDALHVQALPTMVILDRTGKIQWRGEGATAATLARLDRVIASRTSGGDTVRR
ncbi:redoxin domain-containing protein [Tundrisphaera sp. TA3]|uniref:redoxin domain-containing protein n=1 Tax=Tundrisphaera sp. TA3 TaxID=3435775 RepID=UPI003EC0AAD6